VTAPFRTVNAVVLVVTAVAVFRPTPVKTQGPLPISQRLGALQTAPPTLNYEPPEGFTLSVGRDPSAHVSRDGEVKINVYPFRPLNGPFAEQFRRTMLREFIRDSPERRLVSPPAIEPVVVPGAEATLIAGFVEDLFGVAHSRLRVAIYSAGTVSIVDINANSADGFKRNWPSIARLLESLNVGTPHAASAEPGPATGPATTGGADGLYLATTRRFAFDVTGPPGSGSWEFATRFYLLSPDGRFHRGYGLPSVPGGNIRTFDYAKAEREDPPNTGTYTANGGRVVLRARTGETVEGSIIGGELAIENMTLKKAGLK
jgi:hypothetical protein